VSKQAQVNFYLGFFQTFDHDGTGDFQEE
jgi:hypothetical protein